MDQKIPAAMLVFFLFLLPLTALGQLPPPPFRIGGTLTVNGTLITSDNDDGYTVRAVKTDGTSFAPPAEDADGIDSSSGWYLFDVPILDAAEQPGGAAPGSGAVIEVLFNGQKLSVTDPLAGEFTVGNSGENRRIDVEAQQQTANQPPVADAGPDQIVAEGELTTLDGSGSSDPDPGDALSFLWEQIDAGASVALSDPSAVQPTFTAPDIVSAERILEFRLTVADGDTETATDTVSVTVRPQSGQAPSADAGPDQIVIQGTVVALDGSDSSTPDPTDTLAFEWNQISGGIPVALSDPFDPMPTFVAPNVGSGGEIIIGFRLTVENSTGQTDSDTISVTVRPNGNQPPVADAGPNQTVIEGTEVFLDGGGSFDPDSGDDISFQWEQIDGPSASLSNDTDQQPVFVAPNAGAAGVAILEFRLTVRDAANETSADTVIITVKTAPSTLLPPEANAGPDRIAEIGDIVLLDGTGSQDPDGVIISYQWLQIDGETTVSLTGASEPEATFTAPNVQNSQVLRFQLRIIDDSGLDAIDQVAVTLVGDGLMPVADAGPDRTVQEGDTAVLNGSKSHAPLGEIIAYRWTQTGGIGVKISNPAARVTTFTAPAIEEDQILTFQLAVTDDADITDFDTVQITLLDLGPGPGDEDSSCFISALAGDP